MLSYSGKKGFTFDVAVNNRVIENVHSLYLIFYSMPVSHKDWELANSLILLAEISIESSLSFPSRLASTVGNVLW